MGNLTATAAAADAAANAAKYAGATALLSPAGTSTLYQLGGNGVPTREVSMLARLHEPRTTDSTDSLCEEIKGLGLGCPQMLKAYADQGKVSAQDDT